MDEAKLLGILGLASRAGGVQSGEDACREALRNHSAQLLLMSRDVSPGQKALYLRLSEAQHVPLIECTSGDQLGNAIGRVGRKVVAITHKELAKQALSITKAGVAN